MNDSRQPRCAPSIAASVLTLPSTAVCIIIPSHDFPACFGIHFDNQHDGEVSSTGGCTLLRSGSQKGGRATSQKLRGSIVICLFDVSRGDDT